jgi:ATP-dependent DNA ligase
VEITTFKYFYPEKPRLLYVEQPLVAQLSEDPNWVAEKKYNGSRLLLYHIGGVYSYWNRHGRLHKYTPHPDLQEVLKNLNLRGYWLFDGELRHGKTKGVRDKIVLWDVFIAQNELLLRKPFWCRRNIITQILPEEGEPIGIPHQYPTNFAEVFNSIKEEEIEGLVLKNLQGILNLGRTKSVESNWMFKIRK